MSKEIKKKNKPTKYNEKLVIKTDFEGVFKVIKKHKEQQSKKDHKA